MQPYLESLPDHIDGAPPWTPTNRGHGITSRPLKHHQEVSPRDSWIYVLTTYHHIPNKQIILIMHLTPHAILCNPSSFIFHVYFIPSHSSQFGDIELHLIPIPCVLRGPSCTSQVWWTASVLSCRMNLLVPRDSRRHSDAKVSAGDVCGFREYLMRNQCIEQCAIYNFFTCGSYLT